MSLTRCMQKAGEALPAADRVRILERVAELRRGGTDGEEAARMAVREVLGDVRQALTTAGQKPKEPKIAENAAPAPVAESLAPGRSADGDAGVATSQGGGGAATHADPGQPAEPATKAVVAESLQKAAARTDRTRSEMKRELLRMIDEAMADAPSAAANDDSIVIADPITSRGRKEIRAGRRFSEGRDISVVARETMDGKWEVTNDSYDGSGTGRKVGTRLGGLVGTPAIARDQLLDLLRRLRPDGTVSESDYITLKVPGDGVFKVLNSKEHLQRFRKKVDASPGFKDRQRAPAVPRENNGGELTGVESGSSGTEAAIRNMIDDGDPQAAVDFAAAMSVDLTAMLKGDKVRLPKVAGLKPSEEAVAEFAPEAKLADLVQAYKAAKEQERSLADAKNVNLSELAKAVDATRAARAPLVAKLSEQPALSAMNGSGLRRIVAGSAQKPGQWQLTRFDQNGEPWGDSQYTSQEAAIDDFLREVDIDTLEMVAPEAATSSQPASKASDKPSTPGWHTPLPSQGEEITQQDRTHYSNPNSTLDSRKIVARLATEAMDAITQDQKTLISVSGLKLYPWVLPAEGNRNGVVRLLPEDQAPDGWQRVGTDPIAVGGVRDRAIGQLVDRLRSAPIIASDEAPEPAKPDIAAIRRDATLDKQTSENGEVMTRRQWVERKVAEGLKPQVKQEDRIKPMSRMAFFRANNEEQRAHERKIKEAGKKDVYWIGDYEVTKTEHDYAVGLLASAPSPAAPQEPAKPVEATKKPDKDRYIIAERRAIKRTEIGSGGVTEYTWVPDERLGRYATIREAKAAFMRKMDPKLTSAPDDLAVRHFDQMARNDGTYKVMAANEGGATDGAVADNFGQALPPARRNMAAKLDESLTDEDIVKRPFSEIWPLAENEAIEDTFAAAVAHAARAEVPAKPRTPYKLKRWVESVKTVRELASMIVSGRTSKDQLADMIVGPRATKRTLRDWWSKVLLLEQIPRDQWNRVEVVEERPDAVTYEDGKQVPAPMVRVRIDERSHWLTGDAGVEGDARGTVDGNRAGIMALLAAEGPEQRMQFEIRQPRNGGKAFINKKGDAEYRRLMEFDTPEEARKAIKEQYDALVAAWEQVKARDNITERDLRSAENRPRAGKDHRQGKDVTPEEFQDTFGFRGGEFGKWVQQGKGDKERQALLNSAYDALMDLSDLVGIPPKAISLNGTMGIAFGSRGSGWASAHFEPSNLVINLTKTRGAGALGHEWFHALDNYFARMRRGGQEAKFTGDQRSYRDESYITHRPEALMVRKDRSRYFPPMTKSALEVTHERRKHQTDNYAPEKWERDPATPAAVRPEVEARFAALVEALNNSPMTQRARQIDKSADGYWSRTLERAARAFENYLQAKMQEQGYHNDFLANVVPVDSPGYRRDPGRYPYLLAGEVKPIAEAFDALFGDLQTKEEGGNVALFKRADRPSIATDQQDGFPTYDNAESGVTIAFPQRTERMEVIEGPGEQVVNYAIMPRDGFEPYGFVELLIRDGVPVSLLDIYVNPEARKLGVARGVLETILAANPGRDLNISNIVEAARDFWERMGIPAQNLEAGAAYDGTLNWETFSQAAYPGRAQGDGREGGQAGEGGDAGPAGEGLAAARQAAGLNVPELRDLADRMMAGGVTRINVVESVDDMPAARRATVLRSAPDGRVRGAYFHGSDEIYLVARHLHSMQEAAFVVMHEAFHRGLAKTIGPEAKRLLKAMYHTNGKLRAAADAQVKQHEIDLDEAIEEALADMAGEGKARDLRGWRKLLDMIRGWLTKLGDAIGVRIEWTDDMVEDFVAGIRREGLRAPVQVSKEGEGLALQRVFHGTPYRGIERFSTDKIGTGEGQQAYGWGLYFASRKEVAEHYRNTLTPRGPATLERDLGVRMDEADALWAAARVIAGDLKSDVSPRVLAFARSASLRKLDPAALDALIQRAVDVYNAPRGQLYEVEIPADTEMLLWDKPMSEQPENVRATVSDILQVVKNPDPAYSDEKWLVAFESRQYADSVGAFATKREAEDARLKMTGRQFYQALAPVRGPRGASMFLAERGIKGIKYLDGTSRSAGEGSYNYVIFSGDDAEIQGAMLSRSPTIDSIRETKLPAGYIVADLLKSSGKLSWWHKTVGTMHNLAEREPLFRRMYDATQRFLSDVSLYATEAADLAPTLLPKLERMRDLFKSPADAKDVQAVAAPVFEGTLKWTRDDEGHPVETDDVDAAGIRWTDAELRERFKLNDVQVRMYGEFRKATDRSLTDLAASHMVQLGGADIARVRAAAMAADTPRAAAAILTEHLAEMAERQPDRAEVLEDTARRIDEVSTRVQDLIRRGYAPLMRFGRYSIDAVDEQGERLFFGLFDTEREANRFARNLQQQFPRARIAQGTMSEQDYKMFAGVSPETVELFGQLLGLDGTGNAESDQAFQAYLKNAKSNRSALRRLIHRQGVAGFNEDAGRVLAAFVYSNARQTAKNLHAGEMGDALMGIKEQKGRGELLDAAIELHQYVSNPTEEAQRLKGVLFAQFLGGSIAAGLVNMTQPYMVTFPYLSQFGGAGRAAMQMRRATADALKDSTGDSALDAAIKRAAEEGIVAPQEVHSLMAQARGAGTLKSGGDLADKASNWTTKLAWMWGRPFALAEQLNRRITFIAAYRLAVDQKMGDPAAFAARAVEETQFTYNKANRPRWARGAVGGLLFTFKQYSVSYVELLSRMAASGPEGRRAAAIGLGMLMLTAGMQGLPGADDLDDVIDGLMQRLGYNWSSKQKKREALASLIGDDGAQFLLRGVSGLPGAPIDVANRLGLGNLIPGTGLLTKKADYGRDVAEIAGPIGSLGKQVATAVGAATEGNLRQAGEAILPVAAANLLKAYDMATTGMYRDARGRKVLNVDATDAVAKAIGFQPADVARVQNAAQEVQRTIDLVKARESELADRWARGIFEGDSASVADARADLAKWNADNPEARISITSRQILQRVKAMAASREDRVRKTAPKEIRAEVGRQLEAAR